MHKVTVDEKFSAVQRKRDKAEARGIADAEKFIDVNVSTDVIRKEYFNSRTTYNNRFSDEVYIENAYWFGYRRTLLDYLRK